MPLRNGIHAREFDKFVEDANGDTAVRVVLEAGVELPPILNVGINSPTTITDNSQTATGDFTISAVTDQKALWLFPRDGTIWYWSEDTTQAPTLANGGVKFTSARPALIDINADIRIATLSGTADITIKQVS